VDSLGAEIANLLFEAARPHARVTLPEWAARNVYLSARSAPVPGFMQPWPYQREILQVISDRSIPRVSVIKPTRIGYTKCIIAALAYWASERPSSVLFLNPTEDDCRRVSRDEIEPLFSESPALEGLLSNDGMGWSGFGDRDSMKSKYFKSGATLKIVAARSPRNLRSHDCRILLMDEIDAMEVTPEGDPIELAIRRTLAHADRKIIAGSTPTLEGLSIIERLYRESDKRIFEVPCPHCSAPFEMLWEHVAWPHRKPREAYLACPNCGCVIEHSFKASMVARGQWRATAPEIFGHAGFRLNALVSPFENVSWGALAEDFVKAKNDPAVLQVFTNTSLGQTYKLTIDSIDAMSLQARVERFDLDHMPAEICLITCGCDVQHDRIECALVGWALNGQRFILGHHVIHGSTIEDTTWSALDRFLKSKWTHPHGWQIGVDACAIDSGGGGSGPEARTPQVYKFCDPRAWRHIYAIKGVGGEHRPQWKQSFSMHVHANRLFLIGVDPLKSEVLERLAAPPFLDSNGSSVVEETATRNPKAFRLSDSLSEQFFEQLAAERRRKTYVHNRERIEFWPVSRGARTEALDCLIYACAVRAACGHVSMKARAGRRVDTSRLPGMVRAPTMGERFAALEKQAKRRSLSDFGL